MSLTVSKMRTRKSRQRVRQGRRRHAARPFPWAEVMLGALLWLSTLVLILPLPEDFGSWAWPLAERAMLLFLTMILCAGLLMILRPDLLRRRSHLLMVNLLVPTVLLLSRGLAYLLLGVGGLPLEIEPALMLLGLGPLMAAILCGGVLALAVGFWLSTAMALWLDGHFILLLTGFLVTMVAVDLAREAHRRSRVFRAGLWIGLAQALGALLFLAFQPAAAGTLPLPVLALLNGLLCAFLVLLLIPLFEVLFGFTTDITLLELSDMGHPLLRRLALEAPGTYHHSLMLASLAEAAARAIGANGLLVRVCAYYHDIGKLTKPDFFTENPLPGVSPHDDLSPHMSTLVITSHVKEGVTLALQHKLPHVVIEGILQHHGSGLVAFFYHRACQQSAEAGKQGLNPASTIKEGDFRYSGPRPQSREMGILSIADAVEAASRSMEKPTPNRIEHLVEDLVRGKLLDGQMDDCALTLAEVSQVKKALVFTLSNMRHGRVPYPNNENRRVQPSAKPPAEQEERTKPAEGRNGPDAD